MIDQYNQYLDDSEAVKAKEADTLINSIDALEQEIRKICTNHLSLKVKYIEYSKYLPSDNSILEDIELTEELVQSINALKQLLQGKKENISLTYKTEDFSVSKDCITDYIVDCVKSMNINATLINKLNNRKNNLQNEKLDLNRKLIIAKCNSLKKELSENEKIVRKLRVNIESLNEDIRTKEESEKIDKRLKVVECFKQYLGIFFGDKYSLDEDSFCIKFQNNILLDNATDVLSEGEKSVVAFCYYLSDIHKIVNQESDYNKLFLVVDDPISSLDFHHVYFVSQIIRNFGKAFNIKHTRFMLLTHNLEFMSILIRNRIINHRYILTPSTIEVLKGQLVLPYEEHLRDIYDISEGHKQPSHTTPNSIRHVLETINKFVAPDIELQAFCQSLEEFNNCDFLYTLIQDNSHGVLRIQKPYTDDSIKRGCKTLIGYINSVYGGQLKNLALN